MEKPIPEALATFEFFRRCGFTPDEIFIAHSPPPAEHRDLPAAVSVRVCQRKTSKEFTILVGFTPLGFDEFSEEWIKAGGLWNSGELGDRALDIWKDSEIFKLKAHVVSQLLHRGFELFQHLRSGENQDAKVQ